MSSLLVRSARPALRSAAVVLPATRLAVVPARRLATDSQQKQQQQQGVQWEKPVSAPLKAAAAGAAANVAAAAEGVADAAKLKVRQMQNNGTVEEMKHKAAELGVKAKETMNKVSQQIGDMVDPAGAGKPRQMHTSRSTAGTGPKIESAVNDVVDDASRATQKLKNRGTQAGAEVKEQVQSAFTQDPATRLQQKVENRSTQAGAEIKEQGQSLLHSAKKTMRAVGDAVSGAVDSVKSGVADATSPSNPVRQSHGSPELSTSKRPGNVVGGEGESSLGENMSSVKKSLFDGPQTMPQGVGQRAVDENGKPLETGGPRT